MLYYFLTILTGWKRGTRSDHEDDGPNEPPPLDRRESKSEMHVHQRKGRMSFKAASHATLTFLSARKRCEDGTKTVGKRISRRDSVDGKCCMILKMI